jgi:Arc/MetJ-type ribon-helix-helix transcriptional regulator
MAYGNCRPTEKTTLYLPAELHRALKEHAHRSGRSQAELVREALESYLEEMAWPPPGSIGAGEDDSVSARESEDWLTREWGRADHA